MQNTAYFNSSNTKHALICIITHSKNHLSPAAEASSAVSFANIDTKQPSMIYTDQ